LIKDNSSIKTPATLSFKWWGFLYFPVQQIIVKSLEKKSLASFKRHFFLKKVMIGGTKSLGIKLIKNTLEIKSNACLSRKKREIL
jgi:hypothetical protein